MALRNNKEGGKEKKAPFKKVVAKKHSSPDSPFKQFFKEKPAEKPIDSSFFDKEYKPRKERERATGDKNLHENSSYKGTKPSRYNDRKFDNHGDDRPSLDKKDYSAKPPLRFAKKGEESLVKKFDERDSRPPFISDNKKDKPFDKPFERRERSFDKKNESPERKSFESRNEDSGSFKKKLFNDDYFLGKGDRPYGAKDTNFEPREERPVFEKKDHFIKKEEGGYAKRNAEYKPFANRKEDPRDSRRPAEPIEESITRLNKYVAQSGLCSRRKAAELVKAGEITVNGTIELNPAYETKESDVIMHKTIILKKEARMVYVLMNKPKNTITTAEDEKGRKTVLDLIGNRYETRLYPVGRLDRNTTGLLLLTNDGDLAKKLSHPSHQVKKVYIVETDVNVKTSDIDKIKEGIVLDDGIAEVDACDYIEGGKKNEVGIEIHSGKNRIVRRIFESLGYEVVKLDRTYYGGLTKKDLPRGFTRELNEKEIIMLKHFTNQRKKE